MKKIQIVSLGTIVILAIAFLVVYTHKTDVVVTDTSEVQEMEYLPTEIIYKDAPAMGENNRIDENISISKLFQSSTTSEQYSNIVGTFANESFAWYVPAWLIDNWEMKQDDSKGINITFTPKIADQKKISPITFYIEPSTENFNAATMYEEESKNKFLLKEILLSQHKEGTLQILIEPETRIYHIQKEDTNAISDLYMMDGNGYTLRVFFWADKEIFPLYANKIRDMVEGIGEVKAPKG